MPQHVTIPATGSGDATPQVAVDKVATGEAYQWMKIADGTVGGSQGAVVDSLGNLRVALAAATALVGTSVSNFPGTQPVNIASYAVTQPVSIASSSITQPISLASTSVTQPVSGGVTASVVGYVGASVTNFPATQNIQGFIGASLSNAGALSAASQVLVGGSTTVYVASQPAQTLTGYIGASITDFPANQAVTIASTSVTQPVSGNVTASVAGYVGASITGTVPVNIASYAVTQPVSLASTNVTQPVSGNVTASAIGYVGASVTNFPATQSVQGLVGASIANTPTVTLASSTIQVGVSVMNYPTNLGSVTAQNVGGSSISIPAAAPVAGLGASPYHYVSGASVNQVNVKGAAGTLYTLAAMNQNTSQRYLKLFDKATTPSPGTDHPVQTYMIPGASSGAGAVIPLPVGMLFASGIGFAITGQISDLDATAVGASDVVVNLAYS